MSFITDILGPDGALSRFLPSFVYRSQQVEVAEAIFQSLAEGKVCLAEAGTGVGKTMAYLCPAVEQIRAGKRVVISTHTLNLQGQLLQKDIPIIQRAVGDPPFTAVLVKGMGNYLCKFNLDYETSQLYAARDETLRNVRAWVEETETGDIAEIPFPVKNWSDLSCDTDTCHRQQCHYYDDCFYYNMRRSTEKAGMLIVNHALFFSDLAIKLAEPNAGIIPPYDYVIFDEAHHLEEVASRTFGIEFSNYRAPNLLNRVRRIHGVNLDIGKLDALESINRDFFRMVEGANRQEFFLHEAFDGSDLAEIGETGNRLGLLLNDLHKELLGLARDTGGSDTSLQERLEGYARQCARMEQDLHSLLFEQDARWFTWGEKASQPSRFRQCVLHRTPISVADLLADRFWSELKGAVLTSATLSNSGGFSYLRSRLGIAEAHEIIVGSPFDFQAQCLLYVPVHLPFPSNDPNYVDIIAAEILQILGYTHGRAFLLFTSYKMLEAVYTKVAPELDYPVFRQGEMPASSLLEQFKRSPNACLFGASSFWEGVDVQGEDLSCVIMDKLPFSVPDTPVAKARVAAIEQAGGSAFADLSVPEAQIRLKQGFGRLIRTQSDRGIIAIMDSRLAKKSYGRSFLQCLPAARKTRCLDDIRLFFEETADL